MAGTLAGEITDESAGTQAETPLDTERVLCTRRKGEIHWPRIWIPLIITEMIVLSTELLSINRRRKYCCCPEGPRPGGEQPGVHLIRARRLVVTPKVQDRGNWETARKWCLWTTACRYGFPLSTVPSLSLARRPDKMAENQTDANRQFTGTDSQATLRADMGRERPTGRDRSDSSIWLICVLTATLFITGICWRIHEQACSQGWVRNQDRCYFISALETTCHGAKEYCSKNDALLLEINSKEEQDFVSNALGDEDRTNWIGKCEDGEEASSIIHKYSTGKSVCVKCDSDGWRDHCKGQYRFICEKSPHWCTDIPEKIQDLCQQPVGPN
ncbi:uncharacterized protein [Hemitrygon akajei]|uniref:uncharacterized protein n=1 Tax=Hemitrygon akajei TaxID=2704970 RepID=UPI003BF9A1CD